MLQTKVIIIIGVFALVLIFNLVIACFSHYECPKCGKHFQTNGLDMFKPHFMGKREETCPLCEESSMMRRHLGKN